MELDPLHRPGSGFSCCTLWMSCGHGETKWTLLLTELGVPIQAVSLARSAPDLSSVLHDATTASIPHHVLSLRLHISVAYLDSAQLVPPKIVTLLEPCRLKSLKVLG